MKLTDLERQVFDFVAAAGRPVHIEEMATGCFPQLPPTQANSWVRNSLRKLRDRERLLAKTGRGMYSVAGQPEPVQAPPPVVQTVRLEVVRNPAPLTKQQFAALNKDNVESIKRLDCAFYNACLTEARDGDWMGFGCHQCTSHQAMDTEQRVQDTLQLLAVDAAAENEEKEGCAGRKPGVRPGADAKVRPRRQLKLVQTDDEGSASGAA